MLESPPTSWCRTLFLPTSGPFGPPRGEDHSFSDSRGVNTLSVLWLESGHQWREDPFPNTKKVVAFHFHGGFQGVYIFLRPCMLVSFGLCGVTLLLVQGER